MLYLRLPGSVAPTGRVIEMQRRQRALDLSNVSYLQFENLQIVGSRIRTQSTTSSCVFRGIKMEYPAYTWDEELGDGFGGFMIEGNGHQILDCDIRNSTHQGVFFLSGGNHLVKNTVISDCFGEGVKMDDSTANIRVENVTAYNLSGTGFAASARPNQVLYSHGYNTALFTTDCGTLNAIGSYDGLGSEWAYNWMHDAQGSANSVRDWYGSPAIRLDSGPTNFLIHHNLVWNTTQPSTSISIWAIYEGKVNYQDAQIYLYNNSVAQQMGFIETTNTAASIKGVEMSNNLTGIGLSITSSSTNAQGKLYLTDMALRNNVFNNRTIPNDPAPPHSANRTGATGWTSASTPPLGYRLSPTSQAINNGVTIPGITDGFVGSAPDIGAVEAGLPQFVPGAKVRTQDLASLIVTPTVIGNTVKFVITGLPAGRSLPDSFRLKIGGAAASSDFTQAFDFVNNTVTVTSNALSVPGAGQTVQTSLDGTTFTGLPTAITVPISALAATTTSLAPSANPVLLGSSVTFTATVAAGTGTPAGTVTFLDGTITLGTVTLNGSGIATFSTSSLALGLHSITASFPASASHAASTSAILLQSIRTDTTPPGTVRAWFTDGNGAATAQQYPGSAGDGWLDGWTSLIGSASVTTTTPLATVTGSYLQATRSSGSGAGSQAGVYRPWNTALGARPDNRFSRLTFDFRIDSAVPPTAGATFDNASDCYNIILSNAAVTAPGATTTTIFLRCFGASPGNDANGNIIRAQEWCVFNGTPGVSDGYALNKFVRTNMIAVPGRAYTFTFDIYAADSAGTTSGGTEGVKTNGTFDVTITDRSNSTSATVTGSGFRSSAYSTGGYLAFSTQQATSTDGLSFSVDSIEMTGLPTTTALASSGNPAILGANLTFTATVVSGAGAPTGTVTFFDGGTQLGTGALSSSGVATLTTSALTSGVHSITAAYGAAPSYAASNSLVLSQTIQTPVQSWRAQYFTAQELSNAALEQTLWGDSADPESDGLNNMLERALGSHPRVESAEDLPKVGLNGAGLLTLTFKRAASDLTYLVQGTGNLPDTLSWTTIATNPGTVGQTVVVPDNVVATPGPRFLRLRVNP